MQKHVNLVDLVKSFLHVTSISYLLAKCGRAARSRDPPPRRYKFRAATSHPLRRSHEVCAAMRWAFFLFMVQTCSSFQTCKAVKGRKKKSDRSDSHTDTNLKSARRARLTTRRADASCRARARGLRTPLARALRRCALA